MRSYAIKYLPGYSIVGEAFLDAGFTSVAGKMGNVLKGTAGPQLKSGLKDDDARKAAGRLAPSIKQKFSGHTDW